MFTLTSDDLLSVYNQLKDKYPLLMTHTTAVDDGFEGDWPILVGKAHGQVIWLYEYCGEFVMDVMDAEHTKGTHWHPDDVEGAVKHIVKFMEGKSDYELHPYKQK